MKEKETNIKHLLYLSGANMNSYWLGFLITDMIRYLIVIFITFIILIPFNFKIYISIIPVFIFFSLAMCMFIYVFSFFIDKEEYAQKSYFKFYILFLIICISFMSLMNKILEKKEIKSDSIFYYIFYYITPFELNPITSLLYGINRICDSFVKSSKYSDFDNDSMYDDIIFSPFIMIIIHICYFIIEFLIYVLYSYYLDSFLIVK